MLYSWESHQNSVFFPLYCNTHILMHSGAGYGLGDSVVTVDTKVTVAGPARLRHMHHRHGNVCHWFGCNVQNALPQK